MKSLRIEPEILLEDVRQLQLAVAVAGDRITETVGAPGRLAYAERLVLNLRCCMTRAPFDELQAGEAAAVVRHICRVLDFLPLKASLAPDLVLQLAALQGRAKWLSQAVGSMRVFPAGPADVRSVRTLPNVRLASRVLDLAVLVLPPGWRSRYSEEFRAELSNLESRWARMRFTANVVARSVVLRRMLGPTALPLGAAKMQQQSAPRPVVVLMMDDPAKIGKNSATS